MKTLSAETISALQTLTADRVAVLSRQVKTMGPIPGALAESGRFSREIKKYSDTELKTARIVRRNHTVHGEHCYGL